MGYRHGKNTIWYGRPPPGFRIPGSYQYTGERLPKKKEKPKPKVPDVFIRLTDNLELRLRPLEFVFTLFPHSQQRSRDVDDWSVIQVLKRIIKNRHCPEVEIQAFQRGRDFPVGAVTQLLVRNVSEAVARDVASAVISIERGVKLRVEMRPYKPHATFSQLKAKYEEVYGPPETNRCFKDSLPGERPDTIILEGVPVPWLEICDGEDVHKAAARVFGALGEVRKALVRRVFHSKNYSACRIYVQYVDYQTLATALRRMVGMELVRQGSSQSARLTVEVDLEQYLSEAAETRREQDSATKARRAKAREVAELELDGDVLQRRKPARACKAAQEAAAVVGLVVDRAWSTIERLHAEELVAERKAAAQARMAELEHFIAALEARRSELQREQAARLRLQGHGNSLVAGYDSDSEVSSG